MRECGEFKGQSERNLRALKADFGRPRPVHTVSRVWVRGIRQIVRSNDPTLERMMRIGNLVSKTAK